MGMLGAIEVLGRVNEGKSDKETHKIVRQIIFAMKQKERKSWPSRELRTVVNKMDKYQYKLFLEILQDMDEALTDAYGEPQ